MVSTGIFLLALSIIAACSAQHHHHHEKPGGHSYIEHHATYDHPKKVDIHAHPKYEYKYGISDKHTHDQHEQHEHRDGDKVQGEYSLHEPDGTIRIVKYTADHKGGFNAQVIRKGHAVHPENHHKSTFVHFSHGHGHGGQGAQGGQGGQGGN